MLTALLLAIDPGGLGGALLRGPAGEEREAWLAALRRSLPPETPFRKVPLHAGVDRLLGDLDLAATLSAGRPIMERGILVGAHGGILVLPSAERLTVDKAAVVAAAMDNGEVLQARQALGQGLQARFAAIVCDESRDEAERAPLVLQERLAFRVDLESTVPLAEELIEQAEAARLALLVVTVPDAVVEALCQTSLALGVGSPRATLFAVRTARVLAALDGQEVVTEEHAKAAARLVLGPRATRIPQAPEEDEEPSEPDPPPPSDEETATDGDPGQAEGQPLADVILDAVMASLPKGMLAGLAAGSAMRAAGRSGPGSVAQRKLSSRGRPAGILAGSPRNGTRLNLVATLRAAAPWQAVRGGGRAGVKVRKEDFRITRHRQRSETTAIVAVDASGSAALHRLAEAKGAVELMLAECYVRRDKVALVAFRGKSAEILLPPTRSLERARRSLSALPGGGGTPLSAGIDACAAIADRVRRGGGVPLLVFLTDGRANISREGRANRALATDDALASAKLVRALGFKALVIDVSTEPSPAAKNLAEAMAATYLALPYAGASAISRSIATAMPS